jgi:hypothetical protein
MRRPDAGLLNFQVTRLSFYCKHGWCDLREREDSEIEAILALEYFNPEACCLTL